MVQCTHYFELHDYGRIKKKLGIKSIRVEISIYMLLRFQHCIPFENKGSIFAKFKGIQTKARQLSNLE